MFPTVYLTPVASLIAGILILMIPRLLNYIVAIYLIVIGIIGLVISLTTAYLINLREESNGERKSAGLSA